MKRIVLVAILVMVFATSPAFPVAGGEVIWQRAGCDGSTQLWMPDGRAFGCLSGDLMIESSSPVVVDYVETTMDFDNGICRRAAVSAIVTSDGSTVVSDGYNILINGVVVGSGAGYHPVTNVNSGAVIRVVDLDIYNTQLDSAYLMCNDRFITRTDLETIMGYASAVFALLFGIFAVVYGIKFGFALVQKIIKLFQNAFHKKASK